VAEHRLTKNSDGVVLLQSGKYSHRIGRVLVGTFETAQEAKLATKETGGFMSDETYRMIETILQGIDKMSAKIRAGAIELDFENEEEA
jgi:hypothetical protein